MNAPRHGLAATALLCAGCSACSTTSPAAPADASVDAPPGDAGSDAPAPDDLGPALEPYRADAGMPALAGAVFRGDQLVAIGVTGVRKVGDPNLATVADQWHLGSDTKAMTATLVGMFVDQGKLHFDDTIGALFAGETIDPGYQGVTLEQLLQHRGGAPGTMPADIWSQMVADGAAPDARIKAVRALLSRPPAQPPGTYVYANAGYMIAGAALERVAGKTWEEIITSSLFAPLHMDSCGFGAPGTPGQVDEPWGHRGDDAGVLTPVSPGTGADNPPSLGPAGTVHCSLADWGKFLAIQLAGARGEDTIVKAATIQHLQTPPSGGDYADGWIVVQRPWAGGTALTHTGSNTMWLATAWLAPAKNLAYVTATNCATPAATTTLDQSFGALIAAYPD